MFVLSGWKHGLHLRGWIGITLLYDEIFSCANRVGTQHVSFACIGTDGKVILFLLVKYGGVEDVTLGRIYI
jgi:hypothetical protein